MREALDEPKRGRRSRRWALGTAIVLLIFVAAGLVSRPWLRDWIGHWVEKQIVHRLAPGAAVGDFKTAWTSVTIRKLDVPIGRSGARLLVQQVELELLPLAAVASGGRIEDALASVSLIQPELVLSAEESDRVRDRWLPAFPLPQAVGDVARRFQNLTGITVREGLVRSVGPSGERFTINGIEVAVVREPSKAFRIHGSARLQGDSLWPVMLTGELSANGRELQLSAEASVPAWTAKTGRNGQFAVGCSGGSARVELIVCDSGCAYGGSVELNEAAFTAGGEQFRCASLLAHLRGDSLLLDSTTFTTPSASGWLRGGLRLGRRGGLDIVGAVHAGDVSAILRRWPLLPNVDGSAEAEFSAQGDLTDPVVRVRAGSPGITVNGTPLRDLCANVEVTREDAEVAALSFTTDFGLCHLQGRTTFGSSPAWEGQGELVLHADASLFGFSTRIRRLSFSGSGTVQSPQLAVTLWDSSRHELGAGRVSRGGNVWQVQLESGGERGEIEVVPAHDEVQIAARGLHHVLPVLLPEWGGPLASLRRLDARFAGNRRSANIECDLETAADSTGLLPLLVRKLHFAGQYRHPDSSFVFEGAWSGTAGKGDAFEGQVALDLRNRVLRIDRCFVDAAGSLSGEMDLDARKVRIEIAVSDLSFDRLPIPAKLLDRAQLQGTLAGHASIDGSLEQPDWTASLAMTNGAAFGVSDYWLNLDVSGHGTAALVRNFELGRGVRKIVAASGEVDGDTRQIALVAEVGSARAEDFVLALTGRRGLLSGELDGRGTIVGTLPGLNVDAELKVRDGELLNEIWVDEFAASLELTADGSGLSSIRIPDCEFAKRSAYVFRGFADVTPKPEGALRAHIEGSGDFLDILDQMDRAFRSEGSRSEFRMDFGGTFARPRFLGGTLTVRDGRFAYPPATPGVVATEIAVGVTSDGVVDSGVIRFGSGDQWLELRSLPGCDTANATLRPIVISGIGLCLGVLELRTGDDGMTLRFPGLMRVEWFGDFAAGGGDSRPITISLADGDRLLFRGDLSARNARVTFPLVPGSGHRPRPLERWILDRLYEAQWDLGVRIGSGNRYDVEITGLKSSEVFASVRGSPIFERLADYVDHLSIDAILEPAAEPLLVRGSLSDTTFHLNGRVASRRGKVEYLDQTFLIDFVNADFDETSVMPIIEGRAAATGLDSLGRQVPVYLTMYQIDRETGTRQRRGRLNQITFVLEDEAGDASEQVLALLGYDLGGVRGKAGELMTTTLVRAIGRQWLDPLERRLERWTMLDEVALTPGKGRASSATRQFRDRAQADSLEPSAAVRFFSGSQVTVGKYLTRDLYVTYTGELAEGGIDLGNRVGLIHLWNLEYRIHPLSRDLVVDLAVEYDEVERKRDESVSLKYSFALEP